MSSSLLMVAKDVVNEKVDEKRSSIDESINSSSNWWGRGRLPQKIPDLTSSFSSSGIRTGHDNNNNHDNISPHQKGGRRKRRALGGNAHSSAFYHYSHPNLPQPPLSTTTTYASDDETTSFFQSWNYTEQEIHQLYQDFPPLSQNKFNTVDNLYPKMRFLVETIQQEGNFPKNNDDDKAKLITASTILKNSTPATFFGCRLEKVILPKHAYLAYHSPTLPSGHDLLLPSSSINDSKEGSAISLFEEFLNACTGTTAEFASLCNRWQMQQRNSECQKLQPQRRHTVKRIETFERLFRKGLLSVIRDHSDFDNRNNKRDDGDDEFNSTSEEMVQLILNHGANPIHIVGREGKGNGVSLLHWSAGVGNLGATRVLLETLLSSSQKRSKRKDMMDLLLNSRGAKDGATPLHWACCGVNAGGFGCGGHFDICRLFLEDDSLISDENSLHSGIGSDVASNVQKHHGPNNIFSSSTTTTSLELVNAATVTGNTPLMWACWSGSLPVVKLLLRHGADPHATNNNGCTIAHWCCSGGHLHVCQYLHERHSIDFKNENEAGHTPLNHAVTYGRPDVVEWIVSTFHSSREEENSVERGGKGNDGENQTDIERDTSTDLIKEGELAKEFASWLQGDEARMAVLDIFENV
uniref:Ankyrin n=1 Tax=Ditylum brightwellii TaxID=49249 RepID=A0A7S2EGK5_9STRA